MADTEVSHSDDWILVCAIKSVGRLRAASRGIDRSTLRFDFDVLFRIGLYLERSIFARLPVSVAFYLSSLNLCGEGNEKSNVLLPHNAPKVLYIVSNITSSMARGCHAHQMYQEREPEWRCISDW
jgi:hypothetical protein